MSLVHGGPVEKHLSLRQPLPLGPAGTFHERRQSRGEQVPALADVDYVEEHSLVLLHVVHREVEPEPETGIAGVRSQEEIVLELAHQLRFAQVARFEGGVEAQVTPFGLPTLTRRPDYHTGNISQAALAITVLAICKKRVSQFL